MSRTGRAAVLRWGSAIPSRLRVHPEQPGGEQQLIDRAWRRVTIQTALMFAAALLLLDALALAVVVHTGHVAARNQVMQALADEDGLTSPPPGVWLYELTTSPPTTVASRGAPATPFDPQAIAAVARDGRARDSSVDRAGGEYQVRTERRGGRVVQAVLDASEQERERHRLYLGLGAAGGTGLLVAALVGAVIARRAIDPLGQALERQRRFVADASHELRTPLTQLHTRAQLLDRELRSGGDPTRLAVDVQQLVGGTRQLGEIVEDLLTSASLRAAPRGFGPVDLAALAADAVAAELPRAIEQDVSLRVRAEPAGHYLVRGGDSPLRRVLAALLDNALAHTPPGGHIDVELCPAPGGRVRCAVRDDGSGFDPGDAQRVFERFARGGHGDRRRFGLGLALVRETVEAHGGTVTAEACPSRGATFTLSLPAWPEPPPPEPR